MYVLMSNKVSDNNNNKKLIFGNFWEDKSVGTIRFHLHNISLGSYFMETINLLNSCLCDILLFLYICLYTLFIVNMFTLFVYSCFF